MDATIQIGEINEKNSEDSDESVCPSDCSSCYIQSKQKRTMALRKKLLEASNGNESLLDGIVVQMLDNSCLNHSQIELAQSKRKKIPDELAVDVDLDMLMICIDQDLEEEAKAVPSSGGTKKRKLDQFEQDQDEQVAFLNDSNIDMQKLSAKAVEKEDCFNCIFYLQIAQKRCIQ